MSGFKNVFDDAVRRLEEVAIGRRFPTVDQRQKDYAWAASILRSQRNTIEQLNAENTQLRRELQGEQET